MASYKSEVLHQTYRGRFRPRSHYIIGRLPMWAKLTVGSRLSWLVNFTLKVPGLAHIARWVAGVDQRRSLPQFSTRKFTSSAPKLVVGSNLKPVVIWADTFTEYFSTKAGLAALDVLANAGYDVEVLNRPQCCGLTWISTGQLDTAREMVQAAIEQLHPFVEKQIPVLGLEPSCLAVLRHDALDLIDDPRAAQVAAGVFTLAELLAADEDWQAPDLAEATIVVQPHCHQNAVIGFDADMELLRATGATVQRLGGCCGLAGNFGVEKGHYEVSVDVAHLQLLPAIEAAEPGTIVLADGFSCRTQLDDLAGVQALHLSELLAKSATNTRVSSD